MQMLQVNVYTASLQRGSMKYAMLVQGISKQRGTLAAWSGNAMGKGGSQWLLTALKASRDPVAFDAVYPRHACPRKSTR